MPFRCSSLAILDRDASEVAEEERASAGGVLARAIIFAAVALAGVAVVLCPYWIALLKNPINQMPIPHGSRDNYILHPFSGINFWIIPMGAMILAIPFILLRGSAERRLRPLLVGWYVTTLIGLGGTTPAGKILLGRAYHVLTFERFTFWATLMAMPFVGLLAVELIRRFRMKAVVGLAIAAVATMASSVAWITIHPINSSPFNDDQVIAFLNRDDHAKFRYITLGFGSKFAEVSTYAKADSVDGDYNSARLLPEMTAYGAGQLYNSKYFGLSGMESLRAVLKHANQYGLKYVFVRDRYYEPLLAFAGWRKAETYDNGNVTLWTKEDVPPAKRLKFIGFQPTEMQGMLWGILPVASSLLALFLVSACSGAPAHGRPRWSFQPEPRSSQWFCGRPSNEASSADPHHRSDGGAGRDGDHATEPVVARDLSGRRRAVAVRSREGARLSRAHSPMLPRTAIPMSRRSPAICPDGTAVCAPIRRCKRRTRKSCTPATTRLWCAQRSNTRPR